MKPQRFKYKRLNKNGVETGFFSSRGEVTDTHLSLGKRTIPLADIAQVIRKKNRLVVFFAGSDGPDSIALAVTSGRARPIKERIDLLCSAQWAEQHQQELERSGRGHLFRARTCPHCQATVDLSGFDESPELYCPFCETISSEDSETAPVGKTFRICEHCGYFSEPRPFTSFYLIFLIVAYYFQHQRTTRCHACMRAEAWKMLIINSIFVFGGPFALWQVIRAYFASSIASRYPELNPANHAARARNIEKAERLYEAILARVPHGAGIHYNHAKACAEIEDWDRCLQAAWNSLKDCANYAPAADLVLLALEEQGETEKAAAFEEFWRQPELRLSP